MAYTIFESTNMASTKYAERIMDAIAENDVENGTFGYLDGLADGESVIYKFVPGLKAGEPIVVVDQPAWDEDECRITNQRRDKFVNEAGVPFRVRVIKKLDEFGITNAGFKDATELSNTTDFNGTAIYCTIDSATGKLVVSNTKAADAVFVGRVMRKRISGAALSTPLRSYGHSNEIYEVKVETLK